jgi:type II secretory pathway pseudopilin PulG
MRVRPIFLVGLCLAVVAGVLALTLGGGKTRAERFQAAVLAEQNAQQAQWAAGRPFLPETIAAIDLLKLHRGVRRLTTGCQVGFVRCYLVEQPPGVAALELPVS